MVTQANLPPISTIPLPRHHLRLHQNFKRATMAGDEALASYPDLCGCSQAQYGLFLLANIREWDVTSRLGHAHTHTHTHPSRLPSNIPSRTGCGPFAHLRLLSSSDVERSGPFTTSQLRRMRSAPDGVILAHTVSCFKIAAAE